MRFLLDDTEIEAPLRSDGLRFRKERHSLYFSFLLRGIGYLQESGDMEFADPVAVRLLRDRYRESGVAAETRFRIQDDGQTLYDGAVDYARFSDDGLRVSVALRDSGALTQLEASLASVFSITPTATLKLHTRRLAGTATLTTNRAVGRNYQNPTQIFHGVPLVMKDAKNGQTVPGTLYDVTDPFTPPNSVFYRNTTNETQNLWLSGVLKVTVSASASLTAKLYLALNNNLSVPLFQTPVNGVAQLVSVAIEQSLVLNPGDFISMVWSSDTAVSRFNFEYSSQTSLSLEENPVYPDTVATAMNVVDVFSALVKRASNDQLSFRSDFLKSENLFLTNGSNIRGISRNLKVSFQSLFAGLSALYNLRMFVKSGVVQIEPKSTVSGVYRTPEVKSFSRRPNLDWLFSDVIIGFTQWKGETLGSALEINGSRSYRTKLSTIRKTLDLRSDLICSSTLIEEQRRKQFLSETASNQKEDQYDENLFLIIGLLKSSIWEAEGLEYVNSYSNVIDAATIYNIRFTPRRNLECWSYMFPPSTKQLTFESAEGFAESIVEYEGFKLRENQDLVVDTELDFGIIGDDLITIEVPMSEVTYHNLRDYIEYPDPVTGQYKTGLLMSAEWFRSAEGETATLTLTA